MRNILKSFFICLFFLSCFVLLASRAAAQIDVPPAPTLIAPNAQTATSDLTPLIVGLTKDQTAAQIFIDGAYDGETNILNHQSGTANFAYQPSLNLSRGRHQVYAVAKNSLGETSAASVAIDFTIEWPMPAPTMIKAVVNKNTVSARPFITGLAKNNSRIKVYIDRKFSGEFLVKNHQSGTANFAYKPAAALRRGIHQAYAVAIDQRGKVSINSNVISFPVKTAAIAQAAREERKSAIAGIKEVKNPLEAGAAPASEISSSTGRVDNKAVAPSEGIKDLIGTSSGVAKTQSAQGSVNEGRENQGKLKLSLILFILFLVGVVAWLLWVNRELIKERRAQNDAAEKKAEEEKNKPPDAGQENKLS